MAVVKPELWSRRTLDFVVEALSNERLHGSRARRLVSLGLAVMIGDRCVLTIPTRDALSLFLKRHHPGASP